MSIGLCYQRLPRQTTGQQTVRPCNNVSSSPFPFIAALPAGRCSPPAHPAMWLQNPRCTTDLPHRRGDWCAPSAMRPYAPRVTAHKPHHIPQVVAVHGDEIIVGLIVPPGHLPGGLACTADAMLSQLAPGRSENFPAFPRAYRQNDFHYAAFILPGL